MVLAVTKNGHYLPSQLIYTGKTNRHLPKVSFPTSWHIICTENPWANEVMTLQHINEFLLYTLCNQDKKELSLLSHQSCMVIFDRFKAQCTSTISQVPKENNILVPPHCTDRLQPLDIAVNKSMKEFLRAEFHDCYSKQICKQLEQKKNDIQPIDMHLMIVKPLSAARIKKLMDYL